MTIYWLSNHPSNYQIYLFNNLAENPNFKLNVYFIRKNSVKHPWKNLNKLNFTYRFFQFNGKFDLVFNIKVFTDKNALFVIANWSHPYAIFILCLLSVLNRKFVIWTDTPNIERERIFIKRIFRDKWLNYITDRAKFLLGTGGVALRAFKAMGFNSNKFINFPYFIDLKKFQPANNHFNKSQKHPLVFFSSGRLDNNHKGYDVAIKALKIFSEKKKFLNFTYIIAGTGPDKNKLLSLIHNLKINDNIKFLGWLDEDELIQKYKEAHIFLHPSHFEPWGVAIMEAMACGIGVIASEMAGSVQDRIESGKNGFIHKDSDENDLAEKIIWLFDNPEKISELGYNARKTAEKWNIKIAHQVIEKIILDLNNNIK